MLPYNNWQLADSVARMQGIVDIAAFGSNGGIVQGSPGMMSKLFSVHWEVWVEAVANEISGHGLPGTVPNSSADLIEVLV